MRISLRWSEVTTQVVGTKRSRLAGQLLFEGAPLAFEIRRYVARQRNISPVRSTKIRGEAMIGLLVYKIYF